MPDAIIELLITAIVIGVLAWFLLWLVRSLLPEIYLAACVVVGAVALLLILSQVIGLLRAVTAPPAVPEAMPTAHVERYPV